MKKLMTMAVLCLTAMTAGAADVQVSSPDGRVTVTVSNEGGKAFYQVVKGGVTFLQQSPLGVQVNFDDLTQGLTMKEASVRTVKDEYWLRTSKQSHILYEAA